MIGAFAYHFWMMDMTPLCYRNGNQHLHRKSAEYRRHIKRKMRAYHIFIQAGVAPKVYCSISASLLPSLFGDWFGVLAEDHSSGHPAVRIRRSQRSTADASRISLRFPGK